MQQLHKNLVKWPLIIIFSPIVLIILVMKIIVITAVWAFDTNGLSWKDIWRYG